jgi:signal transduction histidine kinase
LEHSVAELQRAARRKNAYLAALSHELRNPLAPIRMAAHLLASGSLTAAQIERLSGVIRRQTRIMQSLIDDLADITRISRGRLQLTLAPVALADIARAALQSVRPLIDNKRHTLQVDLPTALSLHADRERMSQVLLRLLAACAGLTAPGGRIELSARVKEQVLVLHVRNSSQDGGGVIGTSAQPVDQPHQAPGRPSIGLALAEGIVQLHGGDLEVRSDGPDHGCDFIVRLPIGQQTGCGPAGPQP